MLCRLFRHLQRLRWLTNSLAIWRHQPSAPSIPFCGGLRTKPFILVSLGWLATIFVFQVGFIFSCICLILINYLATSVDVERTFSKGRLLLSHIRNRMSAESTRALLCLNNWSKQGFVKQEDLKEAAILPEMDGGAGEKQDNFGMVL